MKVMFHIGMGKTGSTAIQKSLEKSKNSLLSRNMCYAGMWMDMIDPDFQTAEGMRLFFSEARYRFDEFAKHFVEYIEEMGRRECTDTVILSNEAIFDNFSKIQPFLLSVANQVDVSFVLYLRDPYPWLRSAHGHFAMLNKVMQGPTPTLSQFASSHIKAYLPIYDWSAAWYNKLTVRKYPEESSVVDDFSHHIGVPLLTLPRANVRRSEGELAIRSVYNSSKVEPTRKYVFDSIFGANVFKQDPHGSLIEYFSSRGVLETIANHSDLWTFIVESFNISLNTNDPGLLSISNDALYHSTLLELVKVVSSQGERIKELEDKLSSIG